MYDSIIIYYIFGFLAVLTSAYELQIKEQALVAVFILSLFKSFMVQVSSEILCMCN